MGLSTLASVAKTNSVKVYSSFYVLSKKVIHISVGLSDFKEGHVENLSYKGELSDFSSAFEWIQNTAK